MAKKTVTEILIRTEQLLQRSNQWTKHSYEETTTDGQGKIRTCRCLAGAATVAAGLEAGDMNVTNATTRAEESLLKTVRLNPERYNVDPNDLPYSAEGFNDASAVRHSDVLRAVRDTLTRING